MIVKKNILRNFQKLPDLISEFSKVAGYKVNIQNSTVLLYMSNERKELEILKNSTIYNSTKKKKKTLMKHFGANSNTCIRSVP